MWEVKGKRVDLRRFGNLEPQRVLYAFDGPRIFTFTDADGGLCLACWSDEDAEAARFLVVPFSDELRERLERGEIAMSDALNQPHFWAVDVTHAGELVQAMALRLDDVPPDARPAHGTMLLPSLEPVLSLRAVGTGSTNASAISALVEGAQSALRVLANYVLTVGEVVEEAALRVRRLYDLPTQRLALGSFEIAFRMPSSTPDLFRGMANGAQDAEARAFQRIGEMLRAGLAWAAGDGESELDERPPNEQRAILEAVRLLAPAARSGVDIVEVGGRWGRRRNLSVPLTAATRRRVNASLPRLEGRAVVVVEFQGRIREMDKDRLTFELRDLISGATLQKFQLSDRLLDEASAAFDEDLIVKVVGTRAGDQLPQAVIITPAEGTPSP